IHDQHAAPVPALDARPECFSEEEVNRSDHLLPQLTHTERHDRRVEVDVGRSAEHLAEAAPDPASQDRGYTRIGRETIRHISQEGWVVIAVSEPDRTFNQGSFTLVETPADGGAQIYGIGGRGSNPRLVA